ncbi:Crp/Fnr family transcriptional regulator [Parasulfuritortus cantonensis]|uniref:Crp/Fnr family transcriptional regulator n=1 Tax=Parasulfuritortus cantonensis TaxID=2528202 RepID=A0A4R1BE34_9PROT|nr:Crp/Fnr family transcriptional regulator [Parasulfuritortus cantonensis]TCJ15395.1 Crp/Fnr family transcriptional regulator [Parasulfuritortus cantonensis]
MSDLERLMGDCPTLADLPAGARAAVAGQAIAMAVPSGTLLFDTGHACQALPLVVSGSIRVFKRAESGREISLYRVRRDELCIVTISCLLGADAYPATGVAETEVTAVALPRPLFLHLTEHHPPFRQAVFHLFAERLAGLMQLVEEITFRKLDQRLAGLLAARAPLILGSHQQLADELGSVREIVSRLLKQFEEQGWLALARERIEILRPDALAEFASGPR